MIERVEGIIIAERDYSDSSKILDILTKEHGKIGVLAKGCKRPKSMLHVACNKYIHGFFHVYYKQDKLSTLIEVDIVNSFPNIRKDINKSSYLAYVSDLLKQVIKEEISPSIYELYLNTILKIEEGFDPGIISNIFEMKVLDILGVAPNLNECVGCGTKNNIKTISVDKGGYVCHNCFSEGDTIYSEKTIKLLRMFELVDISKISKLDLKVETIKEIDSFINYYYDQYTGIYLMTKEFLKNLKKIGQ